jgi:hypothetical protein
MAKIHHDIVISFGGTCEMLREQRLNCIAGLPVPISFFDENLLLGEFPVWTMTRLSGFRAQLRRTKPMLPKSKGTGSDGIRYRYQEVLYGMKKTIVKDEIVKRRK